MIDDDYMNRVQSKETLRKCREFINDLFVSSGGEKMKFVERRVYTIGKNLEFAREIHFIAEQTFSLKYENLVNEMNRKLICSIWKEHELMRYFKPECVIQVGQKLEALPDLEKINGEKVIRSYVLEEGKVCLIYIWTIYKSICKKQLTFLNDIFERNLWEGSVKFITINTDFNKEYAKKLIKILNVNRLENLYIDSSKHPNHPLFNVVNKYGYPVCVLVNNDNIIELCGSLFEIDVEKKIKTMLERNLVSSTSLFPQKGLNETERKALKRIVNNLQFYCDIYRNTLKAPHLCGVTLKLKKIYTASKTFDHKNPQYSSELDYFCHPEDDKIFESMFSGIELIRKMSVIKNYVQTYEINYPNPNTLCTYCEKNIVDETTPMYYCLNCKAYYCKECGDFVTDLNNVDYFHNHFMYYINPNTQQYMKYILAYNGDNSYDLDFKYFIENSKTEKYLNDVKFHFGVKCDGCLSFPIKCTRWKCCNCMFKNLCDGCKQYVENKVSPFYEDIIYNFEVNGCDPIHHIFLKIIYDSFVY